MHSSSPGRVGTRSTLDAVSRRADADRAVRPPGTPGRVTRTNADGAADGTMVSVTSETRSSVSPYAVFDRASWRALAAGSRLPMDETELRELATFGDPIDIDDA